MLGGRGNCQGVGEIDFRRALRDADLPLTESDTRRIFAHFEVCVRGDGSLTYPLRLYYYCSGNWFDVCKTTLIYLPGDRGEQLLQVACAKR